MDKIKNDKECNEKYSHKRQFGNQGENIVCEILKIKGMKILDRNYLKRCGELDIVARMGNTIHFVEVKTVSRETIPDVNCETFLENVMHRPEEGVDRSKIFRMRKTIGVYMAEKQIKENIEIQIDIACVVFYTKDMRASVEFIENVIE